MSLKGIHQQYYRKLTTVNENPATKKYRVADGDGDIVDTYYTDSSAIASGVCIRQHFVYATTSGIKYVQKEDWFTAEWDIAWNMPEPT